jgi:hypothetical protein
MTTTKKSLSILLFLIFTNFFNSKTAEPETCPTIFDATFWEGNKQVTKKAIYRKDIFKCITGMDESDFVEQFKKNCVMPTLPEKTTNLAQNMSHAHPTLQELKNSAKKKLSSKNHGRLSIIHVDVVKYPNLRHLIDIGSLQAMHPSAVFQTASRPNGLEGPQRSFLNYKNDFNPKEHGFNRILSSFAVQGEEAQISCAIKGIYEIYNTPELINFFDNLNIAINPKGDPIKIDENLLTNNTIESLSNLIRVGHWKNIPVTTGYANILYQSEGIKKEQNLNSAAREKNPDDANVYISHPHLISQVNVTALDLNQKRGITTKLFKSQSPDNWKENSEKLAKASLQAAYEGTLYCALAENKKNVFLTLVGAGSFENKLDWIADTLESLRTNNVIKHSGLNIHVVVVEINGHLQRKENIKAWKRIQSIATKTGGTITSNGKKLHQEKETSKSSK